MTGLFAALSTDEGQTWSVKRLISDDAPERIIDGGGNTGKFLLGPYTAEPRGYMSICQTPDKLIHLISSKQHYTFNLKWLNTPAPDVPEGQAPAGATPEAKQLPAKTELANVFVPTDVPSKTPPWRFTGSGIDEAAAVKFTPGEPMLLDTGTGQRARWINAAPDSFGRADVVRGYTAEITMQIVKSTREDRGIDLEVYGGGRAMISISKDAVYWYGPKPEPLAQGLDNHSASHTYRLAARPDRAVQIYRDGRLLGVRSQTPGKDPLLKIDLPYFQWGEGAGASEADARIKSVAYDVSGAYQPE